MQVIVLGASGMLGSMVTRVLREWHADWDVRGTQSEERAASDFFDATGAMGALDAHMNDGAFVVNCIGITARHIDEVQPSSMQRAVRINSEFPQALACYAEVRQLRVIHMSTDGVFSGAGGPYAEDAPHDATDAYGKTKSLGEAISPCVLNIRTSIVGPSPRKEGLLAWLLSQSQNATVQGFTNHLWHGVTTLQFATMCERMIRENAFDRLRAEGSAMHFAPNESVTKYQLLSLMRDVYRPDLTVEAAEDPRGACSRVLTTSSVAWNAFQGTASLRDAVREMHSMHLPVVFTPVTTTV